MKQERKQFLSYAVNGIINSYSIIFFSNKKFFGFLLMFVTFLNPAAGASGLAAVVISNLLAHTLGLNEKHIENGYYGFNSLLAGLALGVLYEPSAAYIAVLAAAAGLSCIITASASGILAKYNLPFLTIPFVLVSWLIIPASRQFPALTSYISYSYHWGSPVISQLINSIGHLNLSGYPVIYLKSLGAIFFQGSIIAGELIAVGLLFYSRIAFTLSLLELAGAFAFYRLLGMDISSLNYSYLGFNFILTAIALGGFFVIPSAYSYVGVLLLIPVIAVINTALSGILAPLGLSIYALPFNIVVLSVLYTLMLRQKGKFIALTGIQYYTPEENLYRHLNAAGRFKNKLYFHIHLPFLGEWTVAQAEEGSITHKEEWANAYDFIILDPESKPYKENGKTPSDYYCFDKPVLAPADGIVEEIVDHIEDNDIGTVNTEHNWGNSIIIRHALGLFTQLCHLKKHSAKVKKGDFVHKGDIVANCGNSGRSPEPHLHFQVQATKNADSKTLDYPIAYFIKKDYGGSTLAAFEKPAQGSKISDVVINSQLKEAFDLKLDNKLSFEYTNKTGAVQREDWEVKVDIFNRSYIYCRATQSRAYFVNDGTVFYFTDFYGDRNSLLFYSYLAFYRVFLGFYEGIEITDTYPADLFKNRFIKVIQDFIAPFYVFVKASFYLNYCAESSENDSNALSLSSRAEMMVAGKIVKRFDFKLVIENNVISRIQILGKGESISAKFLPQLH